MAETHLNRVKDPFRESWNVQLKQTVLEEQTHNQQLKICDVLFQWWHIICHTKNVEKPSQTHKKILKEERSLRSS